MLKQNGKDGQNKLLILFIDSMGLKEVNEDRGFLQFLYRKAGTLYTSVFPTVTSTCLTSFYTGLLPHQHGIVGHKFFLPEVNGIIDSLSMYIRGAKNSIQNAGIHPRVFFPIRSLLTGLPFPYYNFVPKGIENSGLSLLLHPDSSQTFAYRFLAETLIPLEYYLEKKESMILNLYIASVDWVLHRFGSNGGVVRFETEYLGKFIREIGLRLLSLPPKERKRIKVLILSDHGQTPTLPRLTRTFELAKLQKTLGFPLRASGSGRVNHFYCAPAHVGKLRSYLEKKLRGLGILLTGKEITALAGNGKYKSRVGEILFVATEGALLRITEELYSQDSFDKFIRFSTHGSLTPDELFIPVIRLSGDTLAFYASKIF